MNKLIPVISVVSTSAALLFAGCKPSESSDATKASHGHGHAHPSAPPHGGTPVRVGEHDYHLEFVNDSAAGKMLVYVFDDHLEHAESVPATTFELIAQMGGQEYRATFSPEIIPGGSTTNVSVFAATADWFAGASNFQAVIPKITLGDETFENVTFSFPKGTRHSH